jgi:hypothetical protein
MAKAKLQLSCNPPNTLKNQARILQHIYSNTIKVIPSEAVDFQCKEGI